MDTIFYYRLVEATRVTLQNAGLEGFSLARAENLDSWFELEWLADFIEEREHRCLALLWEGRPLPDLRTLHVDAEGCSSSLRRGQRTGSAFVCGDVAIAPFLATNVDGRLIPYVAVGERRAGALQEFLNAYVAYARMRARTWPFLWVIGGDPLPRPRGLDWTDLHVPLAFRDELRRHVGGVCRRPGRPDPRIFDGAAQGGLDLLVPRGDREREGQAHRRIRPGGHRAAPRAAGIGRR